METKRRLCFNSGSNEEGRGQFISSSARRGGSAERCEIRALVRALVRVNKRRRVGVGVGESVFQVSGSKRRSDERVGIINGERSSIIVRQRVGESPQTPPSPPLRRRLTYSWKLQERRKACFDRSGPNLYTRGCVHALSLACSE